MNKEQSEMRALYLRLINTEDSDGTAATDFLAALSKRELRLLVKEVSLSHWTTIPRHHMVMLLREVSARVKWQPKIPAER